MKYLFGPVPSRRLGKSLGLDVVPYKTCSLDCIYCECGKTTKHTLERKPYIDTNALLSELENFLKDNPHLDYITFSGSGEPTLNSDIGTMIKKIKEMTSTPLAVLTNGTLLFDKKVRQDLLKADLVIPSLDAATDKMFRIIDRPPVSLKIEQIIDGLIQFRKEFTGQIWLEILFIDGYNTKEEEVLTLKEAIKKIKPDRVQLNTVDRPPVLDWAKAATAETLIQIKELLDFPETDIISRQYSPKQEKLIVENIEKSIKDLIFRRPCTIEDIIQSTGLHINLINKYLRDLENKKEIERNTQTNTIFYQKIRTS